MALPHGFSQSGGPRDAHCPQRRLPSAKVFWFVFNFGFGHCLVVFFVHVSLVRSSSRHWSQNTVSHVSQGCTLDLLNWRERSRVSPSHLPVVFHPCPAASRRYLRSSPVDWALHTARASSGLTSLRGTRSHIVETTTRVLRPAGRRIFHSWESSVSVTSCSFPRIIARRT